MRALVVTHCGAGSTAAMRDAAERAGRAALRTLQSGGTALDAVEEAVVLLEDDPRTNAGTGSRMRLDGSIQMDAAVMDSRQRSGAVGAIANVRNPVRVARAVMGTPHILLVGEWATRFARRRGFPFYDPETPEARDRRGEALEKLARGKAPSWAHAWRSYAPDTVGAVARDAKGRFAAACSTGGVTYMLPGRVGDSPVVGAGLYAGPDGAVTATGVGEAILRHVLSARVYDRLAEAEPLEACRYGVGRFPRSMPVGVVAVSRSGAGAASNRDMAWWTNAPAEPAARASARRRPRARRP